MIVTPVFAKTTTNKTNSTTTPILKNTIWFSVKTRLQIKKKTKQNNPSDVFRYHYVY